MINHVVGNLQGNGGRIHREDGEIHQPDNGGDIGEPGVTQGGAERDVRGEILAVTGGEPLPAVRRREREHRVARAFGLLHRVGARAGHGGAGGSDPRRRVGAGVATAGRRASEPGRHDADRQQRPLPEPPPPRHRRPRGTRLRGLTHRPRRPSRHRAHPRAPLAFEPC